LCDRWHQPGHGHAALAAAAPTANGPAVKQKGKAGNQANKGNGNNQEGNNKQ
jgi:hypothetical protein